jgi:hypothetical protein
MGRPAANEPDQVRRLFTGSLTTAGERALPFLMNGEWNLSLFGDFVGTGRLDRSFDGGVTWIPCSNGGFPVVFTAPASEPVFEPEDGVLYSVVFVARTSGTQATSSAACRLLQSRCVLSQLFV